MLRILVTTLPFFSVFFFINLLAKELKIAVLNTQEAIVGTHEARSERSRLEKEMKTAQINLKKKEEELKSLETKFFKQGDLLSAAEKEKSQALARQKFQDLQSEQLRIQQWLQKEEAKSTKQIHDGIKAIVKEIARNPQKSYDLVLEADTVLYHRDTVDLTQKVIDLYNERYPVPGESQIQAASENQKKMSGSGKPLKKGSLKAPQGIR